MNPENEALLEMSTIITPIRMTATGVVIRGPCFLFNAHVSANGTGATTNTLHYGDSGVDAVILDLDTMTSTSFCQHYSPPMYFPRGIFLTVGANLTSITFHILELKS